MRLHFPTSYLPTITRDYLITPIKIRVIRVIRIQKKREVLK